MWGSFRFHNVKKLALGLILISAYSQMARAQILIDEGWGAASRLKQSSTYSSGSGLKATKKIGISATFAGPVGLFGTNLDINFTEDFALSLGVGLSQGFNSFNVHMKRTLGGESFQPYFAAGYSRWSARGNEGSVEQTTPGVLADKFLSDREKRTGEFVENIIYPGLGLQYLTLDGDWQGLGVFAELQVLLDLDDIAVGTTASVGSIYYF